MPQEVADIFRSELDFQPEDITSFTMSPKKDERTGQRSIEFRLDRQGYWWTITNIGLYHRKDYDGFDLSPICIGEHGQVRGAREAGERLRELNMKAFDRDIPKGDRMNAQLEGLDIVERTLTYANALTTAPRQPAGKVGL
jgi:hypothetical protein